MRSSASSTLACPILEYKMNLKKGFRYAIAIIDGFDYERLSGVGVFTGLTEVWGDQISHQFEIAGNNVWVFETDFIHQV